MADTADRPDGPKAKKQRADELLAIEEAQVADLAAAEAALATTEADIAALIDVNTTQDTAIAAGVTKDSLQDGVDTSLDSRLDALEAVGAPIPASKMLRASSALNFPSILAGNAQTLTITVTGAAIGDDVTLHYNVAPDTNIQYNAWVSANNTVTVQAINRSAAPVDPANLSFRVIVWKA